MAVGEEVKSTDVIIIGGGTGGYATALRARGLGLEVTLIDKGLVGGTCLHRGCIPSKALLHAAEISEYIEEGKNRWGISASLDKVDPLQMAFTRDDIVEKNHAGLLDHLHHDGIKVIYGSARLIGDNKVLVSPVSGAYGDVPLSGVKSHANNAAKKTYPVTELTEEIELSARRGIVLAMGSKPRQLPAFPEDGNVILTSDTATRSVEIPNSVLVVGAGAIGVEFATFYHAFGAKVTICEALGAVLPTEDQDVSNEMARALKRKNIDVLLNSQLKDIQITKKGAKCTIATPNGEMTLEAEKVLVAIGRIPVSENTGLEEVGVKVDRGYVVPSDWATLQTSVPGIYAVGDILPPPSLALAHASFAEGIRVAEVLAGIKNIPIDYAGIPRATYSHPEAASVGLTEKQAKDLGYEVVTNKVPLTSIAKGLIYGQGGMVKIVAEKNTSGTHEGAGKVLGVHLVGPHVTEMISEGMLIYNWEALPMEVAEYIHPHPSLSEAFGEASLTLANRRLHQMGK